jgi:pilus assembly protein CpaB
VDVRSVVRGEVLVTLTSAVFACMVVSNVAHGLSGWEGRVVAALRARTAHEVVVPVLLRPVGLGEVIGRDDVGARPFPAAMIPDGAVRDAEVIVGRTALEPILAGELVRAERLSPTSSEPGLQAAVSPGLRAMSLDLKDEDRVSGFVTAGARVDVLATLVDGHDQPVTVTLVEAVEVLATTERVFTNDQLETVHRPNVTLALSPVDAERLVAVPGDGQELKLALRGDVDFTSENAAPVRTADLGSHAISIAEMRAQVDADELARMEGLLARTPLQ